MARTWTLEQTLSIVSGGTLLPWTRALVNGVGTEMYFLVNSSSSGKIYSWNGGASLTDIAGSSFPISGGDGIGDICIFDNDLFTAFGNAPPSGTPTSIYRWTGGTSWTNEYTLTAEPAFPSTFGWIGRGIGGVDSWVWPMDRDANYMAVAGTISSINTETFRRVWTRNTSGTWNIIAMPGGGYSAPGYQLVGLSKGSDYGTLFGFDRTSSTNFRPMTIGASTAYLAAAIGAKVPIGYGDGKSFFSHNTSGSTWELKYSTDFGVNLTAAGGLTRTGAQLASWKFKNLGGGIIMLGADTDQAYTWDPATDTFVVDGDTATNIIYDYFILNGELFALTDSATANSVEIWSAGMVSSAGFYYGRSGLQYRAALPFPYLNIGGLAVAHPYAILGSGAAAAQMVAYAEPADDYGSFTDFTGALSDDPIMAFDATPWGDAAGAAESGEDAGPGGHLGEKC